MENSYNNNNNNINNTGSNKKYVKDKLKKLSRYAKERGMVKDYGDIASTYMTHVKYLSRPEDFDQYNNKVKKAKRCLMCKSRPCKQVFFPCRHACVCDECIVEHNIGTKDTKEQAAWRACPLCMDEIKRVLPRDGQEESKYWEWVYDVKPPIPSAKSFVKQFKKVGTLLNDDNRRNDILEKHNSEISSVYRHNSDENTDLGHRKQKKRRRKKKYQSDSSDGEDYMSSESDSEYDTNEKEIFWHIKEDKSSGCCIIV